MKNHDLDEQGHSLGAKIGTAVATVGALVLGTAASAFAQATPDTAIVSAASSGMDDLAATMKAIGMAAIPLALGIFAVTKGWRMVKRFF